MRPQVHLIGVVGLLVASMSLAGCIGQAAQAEDRYLDGRFTENMTSEDHDRFDALVDEHDAKAAVFTVLPASFHVKDLSAEACADLQSTLSEADYVAEVGECKVTDRGAPS